ncbi:MAG: nuclear transport factor 2 family protein, partial [Betaproteobacteria bacterium]
FTKLAEDYPELPEPYNNLAVLYAGQGNYDMARIALEMAIATNPSYATAHENLGDIYAKMASQAYDKALQLDKGSAPTPTKLALVKELSGTGKGNRAPAKSEIARLLAAKPMASSPAAPVKATKPYTPPVPAVPPVRVATRTEPVKPVSPPSKPAPAPRKAEGKETSEAEAGVLRTLNAWTKAWSDKNAAGYLAHYARDFKTPKGENRSAWEKTRKERITRPKSIHVTAGSPQVKQIDATHASVTFRQIYKSDALQTSTWKTLVLVKSGERWFIQQERIGR